MACYTIKSMILITGASGHVGGRIAEILSPGNIPLRLTGRNKNKIRMTPDAEIIPSDYADTDSLDKVFKGIETAFIVSGYAKAGERARLHKNAIEAAVRAGVKRLVYLSIQNPSPHSKFPMSRDHYETEKYLEESGIPFIALRDNLYMDMLPEMFDEEGILKGPAGNGATAWVSREDVAQAAAAVLADPALNKPFYNLSGPEALTMTQVAEKLSVLTGRSLRYQEESTEEARAWRSKIAGADWMVETWVGSYEAIAAGEFQETSEAVKELTGRDPYDVETYFKQYSEALKPIQS